MTKPERILVLETSALLAVLREFTDAHALKYQPHSATRPLEGLLSSQGTGGAAVDQIVIPDHVLYEATGLLPICYARMLQQFAEAKNDPEKLTQRIELYAFASPRGEMADRSGQQKKQIELLLRFIADHPESLVETQTGMTYCNRLRADYSTLSSANGSLSKQYRPTFADALHYLPDAFDPDPLKIHAGQMLMMGMIDEDEFNERLGLDEKAFGRKKRFYKAQGVVNRLEKELGAKADKAAFARLREQEGLAVPGATQVDFTFGMLRRHPWLLDPQTSEADEQLPLRAIRPCTLLMEHYLFGGILPNSADAVLVMADSLGFSTQGLHADGDEGKIRDALAQQGFFELSPTMQQLEHLQDALQRAGFDTQTLARLTQNIRQADMPQTKQFRDACAAGEQGLPYEKVFSDALINGQISWDEFWRLADGYGMHLQHHGYRHNERADILVQPGSDKSAQILVAQQGFAARRGMVYPGYLTNMVTTVNMQGRSQPYIQFNPNELISRCRAHLSNGRHTTHRLHPIFESMLYREVVHDPVGLRVRAEELLGPERLLQIEKDYANRHARRVGQRKPPYSDIFTALHTNSRIQRKNLGEVATLEAAKVLLAEYPDAHIWISNHDSDLVPTAPRGGNIALEDSVVRQHAGFMESVRSLNEDVAGKSHLHFLSTPRLLDDMHRLLHRSPPAMYEHLLLRRQRGGSEHSQGYEGLAMKRVFTDFPNTSWDLRMRRVLPANSTQR